MENYTGNQQFTCLSYTRLMRLYKRSQFNVMNASTTYTNIDHEMNRLLLHMDFAHFPN